MSSLKPLPQPSSPSRPSSSGTRRAIAEARKSLRSELFFEVEFEFEGVALRGFCRNVSLGGMFVETCEPAPFGARVVMIVPLPGLRARVESVVRWTSDEGMGVQFGPMGARATHALMQLLSEK